MSHAPDDRDPLKPKKPRPADGSAGRSESGGKNPSTFRPNPSAKPAPAPGAGSAGVGKGTGGTARRSTASGASSKRSEPMAPNAKWWERLLFGRISSGQLAQFCRQFASYLNAGIDYNRMLPSLEQQFARSPLGPALGRMRLSIKNGSTLEEAMAREPQIFDRLFISMIRVAEARGGVPETMRMLADHYESRARLIRQARSAMIYPIIVLIMAGGVVALLTVFLLPMFADLLRDIGRGNLQLPLPSRMLLAFSSFVGGLGKWLIPVAIIGTPFLLLRFYKTESGKSLIDRLILKTPVFGSLFRKIDTSRFAKTLGTLLDAGVDVGTSIKLTSDVMALNPMRDALMSTRDQVMHGKELSAALLPTGQFTPDVIAVLESGEETGSLPETLNHLAEDYEEQVSVMVKNLGHLIQPLVTVMLGGLVLFIILAVFLPYLQMLTGLSRP